MTKNRWKYLKENLPLIPETAFAGVACSFGSVWFCSYAKLIPFKSRNYTQNHALCGYNNAVKQSPLLKGIKFTHSSYDKLDIPPKSIIYWIRHIQDPVNIET